MRVSSTTVVLILVLCLLLCSYDVLGVNPGIKVTVTQKGLNYAKDVGIQILLNLINTIDIPNQSGTANVPVIGGIDWGLSNIKLGSLKFPQNAILPVPGQGLRLVIASASAAATANWNYREHNWPHISDHGSVDISLEGVTISVTIGFGESQGEPNCAIVSETISVNNVDIHVHGGPSWLYNFLLSIFKGQIKDALTSGLEDAVKNGISNSLNDALNKIPMRQRIGDLVVIDYSLTNAPRFSAQYLVVDGKGEFFDAKNPSEAPFVAQPLPDLVSDRMLQVAVSDYLANTAGFAFWKAGALTFHISADQVPSSSPLQFNTDSFKVIIPELYQKYPGKNMSAVISPNPSPAANATSEGVQLVAVIDIDMFVIVADKPIPVFTLLCNAEADGKALINGKQLYGNITDAKFKLSLKKSYIGNFDTSALNGFAEFVFEAVAIPFVNSIIGKGIVIPTIPHVEFVSPLLTYGPDYVIVSTDLSYTASLENESLTCK